MDDSQDKNKRLAQDIIETIAAMLERPQMFASSPAALENQFWLLVVLVSPYFFGMSSEEAGRKINEFTSRIVGGSTLISSKELDIEKVASYLKKCYEENFDFPIDSSTIH